MKPSMASDVAELVAVCQLHGPSLRPVIYTCPQSPYPRQGCLTALVRLRLVACNPVIHARCIGATSIWPGKIYMPATPEQRGENLSLDICMYLQQLLDRPCV